MSFRTLFIVLYPGLLFRISNVQLNENSFNSIDYPHLAENLKYLRVFLMPTDKYFVNILPEPRNLGGKTISSNYGSFVRFMLVSLVSRL